MNTAIPKTALILCEDFSKDLVAEEVGAALARGFESDVALVFDLCPMAAGVFAHADIGRVLDARDFDRRLRAARCLVIVTARLADDTLPGSVAFEAATRARQGGVPAYAVTAHDELDPFEARIVDLQVVLQAASARALAAAGRKLAALV